MQQCDKRREQQRDGVEVERERFARGAVGQARAGSEDHWAGRAQGQRGDRGAADQPRPPGVSVRGQRAREQQRADRHRLRDDRWLYDGLKTLLAEAALEQVGAHEHHRHHDQPPAGLQEVEVAREEHPECFGRAKGAREQGRQVGAQTAGGGEADAETDIEEEPVHISCATVRGAMTIAHAPGSSRRRGRKVPWARRRIEAQEMDRSISGAGGGRRGRETAHELARYEALFAARTRGMKSSAMREMMALTERPDVISLAGGLPDTSTFAPELYAKLMSQVAAESTARALQYGPTEGMAVTVDCIVEVMAAEGTAINPANVIVTTGGQQVIDLVCKALIDPGDVIVAEAPTYPGAVPTFGAYQADVVQIEMDADGMPIDELELVLDRLAGEGRRPKFIYTIPNFQNPGGVTMSLPRRRRLVEVARERELLVLEDNPYGLLRYEGEPLPTLYSLDALLGDGVSSDLVIYLGTFSKILSPGLRLGWSVAPRAVLEKLNLGKQGTDLCSSPMTQLFVAAYFAERGSESHPPRPAWIEYVERLKELYRRRRDVMLEALQEHFGGRGSWTRPEGGLFIWATLDGRRHDRPDGSQQRRRVRAGPLGIHGRGRAQRRQLDATELRGRARGGHPRGHPPDQRDRGTGYGAVDGHIERRPCPRPSRATGEPRPPQRGPALPGRTQSWRRCSNCRGARQRTARPIASARRSQDR